MNRLQSQKEAKDKRGKKKLKNHEKYKKKVECRRVSFLFRVTIYPLSAVIEVLPSTRDDFLHTNAYIVRARYSGSSRLALFFF